MSAFFEYKGISSLDLHLRIRNDVSFPSPEADIDFVEIMGRDGELAVDNDRLKGVNFYVPVTLILPADKTVAEVATDISNWLKNDVGWFPLRFSGSPQYEYIAICYGQFDIAETLRTYGKTVITFRLKPYKRLRGDEVIDVSNGETLINPNGRASKPLIYIEGDGDVTLNNNGKDWLMLTNVDGNIAIDSESMSVYKGVIPYFPKMKSHLKPLFPILESGSNEITWTGDVTKVEVTPRFEVIT